MKRQLASLCLMNDGKLEIIRSLPYSAATMRLFRRVARKHNRESFNGSEEAVILIREDDAPTPPTSRKSLADNKTPLAIDFP